MATIECAYNDCHCKVDERSAFQRNSQLYCNELCANGVNCGHAGCRCHED